MHSPLSALGVALGLSAFLPGLGAAQSVTPDAGGVRIGQREAPASEEEAAGRLRELLPRWAEKARRYKSYALQFLCTETHRTIDYSRAEGEARKEKEVAYGYLLTVEPKSFDYQVLRQTVDAEGHPTGTEKVLDLSCPEPYTWTLLFLPTTASTMRFHYLGIEIQNYRLTHVVTFEGAAPRLDGKDIREWSGTVWVEENTGSLVRVEARPNFQNDRILALWREYQQSFSLPWGKSRPRPHGYAMAALFDFESGGLLFPSRLDLTDFTWLATNREVTDSRLVLTYDDYRFFRTETHETVHQP